MNTQNIVTKIDQMLLAWSLHAPDKKFLGVTVDEARAILAPAKWVREQIAQSDNNYSGLMAKRTLLDDDASAFLDRLVNAVRAEVDGINSPLYSGMGYVTKSARRSGLSRKGTVPGDDSTTP